MKKTKTEHSPLPWEIKKEGQDEFWFGRGYLSLRQKDNIDYSSEICPISPSRKTDAEFIVRACNSFEALLEACKEMTTLLQNTIVKYVSNGTVLTDLEWDKVSHAWGVIKQAETTP